MNVERIFFWIRLVAEVILGILDRLQGPGNGEQSLKAPGNGFKPERVQLWLGIVARAALTALDEVGAPPAGAGAQRAGFGPDFKPERIQFWIGLIARFVLAVLAGMTEETGKSGEPPAAAG